MKADRFLPALCVVSAASLLAGCGSVATPADSKSTQPDIYVAGIVYESTGRSVGTYWKNGVATSVGDNVYGSYATGIAVSGSDVYVAGAVGSSDLTGHDMATYWKNGAPYPLTDGTREGYANALAISGNDVYVAGGYFGGFDSSGNQLPGFAGYWKNGSPVDFSNGSWGIEIRSIFVSGSDVYVAGAIDVTTQVGPNSYYETPVATIWKNGVPTQLTDSLHPSRAFSVFVPERMSTLLAKPPEPPSSQTTSPPIGRTVSRSLSLRALAAATVLSPVSSSTGRMFTSPAETVLMAPSIGRTALWCHCLGAIPARWSSPQAVIPMSRAQIIPPTASALASSTASLADTPPPITTLAQPTGRTATVFRSRNLPIHQLRPQLR